MKRGRALGPCVGDTQISMASASLLILLQGRGPSGHRTMTEEGDISVYPVAPLNGRAAFATRSVAWAIALAHHGYQNNVSPLTANVLLRFLDPAPF